MLIFHDPYEPCAGDVPTFQDKIFFVLGIEHRDSTVRGELVFLSRIQLHQHYAISQREAGLFAKKIKLKKPKLSYPNLWGANLGE